MPPDEGTPAAAAGTEANGAAAGAAPAAAEGGQTVPYDRFQKQGTELKSALGKIQTYETELGTLRATAAQADTFRAQAEAASKKYDTHMAIGRALGGLPDPDVVDLIAERFDRLHETERAAGLGPVLEAWKSDPTKAPASVRPHFQPPPVAANGVPLPPARAPVDPHRSVVQTPNPAQGQMTADQLNSMSQAEYIQYSNAQRVARGLAPHPTK